MKILCIKRFMYNASRVYLAEVVPGDLGEQVVVHLVLETAAEPVHERRASNVAGGRHLLEQKKKKTRSGGGDVTGEGGQG